MGNARILALTSHVNGPAIARGMLSKIGQAKVKRRSESEKCEGGVKGETPQLVLSLLAFSFKSMFSRQ